MTEYLLPNSFADMHISKTAERAINYAKEKQSKVKFFFNDTPGYATQYSCIHDVILIWELYRKLYQKGIKDD